MRYSFTTAALSVSILACLSLSTTAQGRREARGRPQQTDPVQAFGLDREIDWIRDPETYVDGRRVKRGITGSVDRPALLDSAIAKAKKSGRLVLWYVYRVVEKKLRGMQMYRAPVLDCYMQHVLFADPDVSSIIQTRFVPLRMVMDESMSQRFNLRPLKFIEPAVVFVDGNGELIHYVERFRTFDANWFADLLRRVLAKKSRSTPRNLTVDKAIAEGRWEWALAQLRRKSKKRAADYYLLATLHRRLRQLEAADQAIEKARKAAGKLPPGVLTVEAMRVRALRGDMAFQITPADIRTGDGPRTAEGLYYLAAGLVHEGDHAAASKLFTSIAQAHPDDSYGRKAKANVTIGADKRPMGPTLLGWEHLSTLPSGAYAGLQKDTQWAGKSPSEHQMATRAVQFLLTQQRQDGGFTQSRYAYWPNTEITTNTWVAITALAATALHLHREVDPKLVDPARVDAAVAKAKEFMFNQGNLNRGRNEDVYADTYRLYFLATTAGDADPAARKKIITQMHALIEQVRGRQKASGFWAHEYQNAFCSAAMLWGLLVAQRAGAEVPEEMISKGISALWSARFKTGTFIYGGSATRRGGRRTRPPTSLKNSSARMPVCEGALFAYGRSDEKKLAFAFETFWRFIDRIEGVRRNDFHSDGELGGFFFFHALYHASESNKLLPKKQQADNRRRFIEVLQRIPEMDGSFLDSHEFGRSYGTAMALLTLANVTN